MFLTRKLNGLLRAISILWHEYWYVYRAEQRKRKDSEQEEAFHRVLRTEGQISSTLWHRIPKRLHYRFKMELPKWLEDRAESTSTDLPVIIRNVRACGVEVSVEEEKRLYQKAMDRTYGAGKLQFAKMLHGTPLTLEIVLDILRETGETRSLFGMAMHVDEDIKRFLQEIDTKDPAAIDSLLQTIAENGNYLQLQAACDRLKIKEIPPDLLHTCMHAQLSKSSHYPSEVTEMCIALRDWEMGKRLIHRWKDDRKFHQFVGRLAVAMLDSGQLEGALDAR